MTLSHGLSVGDRAEPTFSVTDPIQFASLRRTHTRARRGRKLIAIWAVLSIGWAGAVVVEVCHQARVQADLTGDIDHDLDPVACVGPSCTDDSASDADRNWPMIVVTYLQWDMAGIAE